MPNTIVARRQLPMGFTLLEVIIVITILSILTLITMAYLDRSRVGARNEVVISQVHEYQKAFELYYASEGAYPSPTSPGPSVVCLATNRKDNCIAPVDGTSVTNTLSQFQTYFPYIDQGQHGGPAYSLCVDGDCSDQHYAIYYTLEGAGADCGGRASEVSGTIPGLQAVDSSFTLCQLEK